VLRLRTALAAIAALALGGCLTAGPQATLDALLRERGEPDSVTVFRATPGPGERPLSELRETLAWWAARGSGDRPRWEGTLVPSDPGLHASLIERIDAGIGSITLRAWRFDARWQDDLTLVDYVSEEGELMGWDHTAHVLPPRDEPRVIAFGIQGYFQMAWWEIPVLLLDIPVYLAVGAKELAGEAVKSPLAFVTHLIESAAVERRSPVSPTALGRAAGAFAEPWKNGVTALIYRFRVRSAHTPIDLLRELAAAVPIVGPVFEPQSPPEDDTEPPGTSLLVLTGGVHGSSDEAAVHPWARALEALRPEAIVATAAYPRGTVLDPVWSMLNLSSGPGHDLAARILFDEGAAPRDGIEIAGFSAGFQRGVTAARLLRRGNVSVNRLVGVAGAFAGGSPARTATALLGEEEVAASIAAHLWPFPENIAILRVRESGRHHLPCFPDGATRAPNLGYLRLLETLLAP
jgi:hypothetical protein